MKELPILFSGPMVRAILDGRKTQTRRIIKPQPVGEIDNLGDGETIIDCASQTFKCPHGYSGDRFWVSETWYCDDYRVQVGPYIKPQDMDAEDARANGVLVYRADGDSPYECEQPIWRPSIFMPRWASRITLEILGVRVERLQDISEEDAVSEGVDISQSVTGPMVGTARGAFCRLWESINGPGSWDSNPWVWVIEFKRP